MLTTGKPCVKTHTARQLLAAATVPPENFTEAALRTLRTATSESWRLLFRRS
ncbi:MAG TPA: hypothetical protein VMH85_05065 [Terriglobales bacterium]|nr:hypothetical protein [Terriglobales bacterium]